MRITCPGCGAQYEVADEAIPPGGRDVQCSACGNVWFVTGAAVADPEPDAEVPDDTAAQEESGEPDTGSPDPDSPAPAPPAPAAQTPVAPRRPALSPEVTAILREEAERERARREAERAAQVMATQPDLGLDEVTGPVRRRTDEARAAMAELRAGPAPAEPSLPEPASVESGPAEPPPGDAHHAPEPPRGRERLPDIEEINASLRAATERAPAHVAESPGPRVRPGGFRTGFLGVIVLAGLALAVYAGAPRIAQGVPAAAPHLERYIAGVDDLRLWLDRQVQGLIPAEGEAE